MLYRSTFKPLTVSSAFYSIWLSLSLSRRSALHANRSIATLQASEGESPVIVVTCSTQHFRGRPGCLFQVHTDLKPVVTWQRCRAWWAGAAWSILLKWTKTVSSDLQRHLWTAVVTELLVMSRGLTSHSTLYRSFRGRFFTDRMTPPNSVKALRKPVGRWDSGVVLVGLKPVLQYEL